jgi:hypothetical protein
MERNEETSAGTRGYLTLAVGRPAYLDMAVDMALSLREHTALPVGVVCDETLAVLAREQYAPAFDSVTLLPERFVRGRVRKYGIAEASPFAESVFVDADCVVLGPLDHLFEPLARHSMAMLGEQLTLDDDENHHGFSTRWLMRRFELERYLKTNSGVFAFRRDPAREIMEAFLRCFEDEARPRLRWPLLRGAWLGDEIAIGIVGGRLGLATLGAEHPMYWPSEFESIDPDRPSKPLLHFIWPPNAALLERLLEDMRRRRRERGVGGDGAPAWRAEVRELEKMKRRRLLLERLGWW